MRYYHVDVFSAIPAQGNGLAVVFPEDPLPADALLAIAREFNQYETIFLDPPRSPGLHPARIFTLDEELPFAGHPVLGAGAVLHSLYHPAADDAELTFALGDRRVVVQSRRADGHYRVSMNQGRATFKTPLDAAARRRVAAALGLRDGDLMPDWPVQTVSTGLSYLLVPLRSGLARSRITHPDMTAFLAPFGAAFAYVFDASTLECRTWDNTALHREDIATGSAAGPLAAYLVRHEKCPAGEEILIRQGAFLGRPSIMAGMVQRDSGEVTLAGDVSLFAAGTLF